MKRDRNNRPKVFLGKCVPKICIKFTGEHTCQSVISIKLFCNLTEISLRHGCSSVNLLHIFSIPFPKNTCGGLLLKRACDKFCDKVSACWRVPVVHSETGNNLFHLFSIVSNLNLANSAKVLIFDKLTFFDLYLYMLKQP